MRILCEKGSFTFQGIEREMPFAGPFCQGVQSDLKRTCGRGDVRGRGPDGKVVSIKARAAVCRKRLGNVINKKNEEDGSKN